MSDAAHQFGLLLAPYFAALLLTGGALFWCAFRSLGQLQRRVGLIELQLLPEMVGAVAPRTPAAPKQTRNPVRNGTPPTSRPSSRS